MKEKTIIKALRKTAKEKVYIDEEKKDAAIAVLVEKEIPVRKMGTFKEFLLSQLGFINKVVFFWQVVWALLFFYAVRNWEIFHIANGNLCILSMAPPLLLMLTIDDVSRIYNRSMLEIEYATKYSLKKTVMARMFILSVTNGAILVIGMIYAKEQTGLKGLEILIYGLTPLILMTSLLLMFMKRWSGEQLKYAGATIYIIFAFVVLAARSDNMNIYRKDLLWAWMTLSVFGMIVTAYQFKNFTKHLDSFELLTED